MYSHFLVTGATPVVTARSMAPLLNSTLRFRNIREGTVTACSQAQPEGMRRRNRGRGSWKRPRATGKKCIRRREHGLARLQAIVPVFSLWYLLGLLFLPLFPSFLPFFHSRFVFNSWRAHLTRPTGWFFRREFFALDDPDFDLFLCHSTWFHVGWTWIRYHAAMAHAQSVSTTFCRVCAPYPAKIPRVFSEDFLVIAGTTNQLNRIAKRIART